MKYARINYSFAPNASKNARILNVGDWFQTFAIDHIYSVMGIKKEDIVDVGRFTLNDEPQTQRVVLPLQGYFGHFGGEALFPINEQYKPVFLGYHSLSKENYEFLDDYKRNEPIGCRDEATYNILRRKGIDAFLSGCMTITLPRRPEDVKPDKVFLVDVPSEVREHMPKELSDRAVSVTHEIPVDPQADYHEAMKDCEAIAKRMFEEYRDHAMLVVTSRLHCAAPCLAMGIPVIMVRKYFDERYGWIDRYTRLYTLDKLKEIDWYPEAVDLEAEKKRLIELASSMLRLSPNRELNDSVSRMYLSRDRSRIHTPLYVKAYWKVLSISPAIADTVRQKLRRFSILGNSDNDK